mmetsp:Transcript_10863/g.44475  ORF Transcript_10863/g.44475 Transcript_10863/m.44475 type:complete len:434 (+) Transcript_10863:1603-2904(+)
METLEVLVHPPSGLLAVVGGLDSGARRAVDITTSKDPRSVGGAGDVVDLDEASLHGEGSEGLGDLLVDSRAEGGDDEVSLDADGLLLVLDVAAIVLLLHTVELHGLDVALLVQDHLLGGGERKEVAVLVLRDVDLLGHSAHVAEGPPEAHGHALRAAAEGGRAAVERRVTGTEHDDMSVKRGQLRLAAAHAGLARLGDLGEEALRGEEALLLRELLEDRDDLRLAHANSHEHALEAVLLQALECEVAAKRLATLDLDAKVSHELDLEVDDVVGKAVAGDLSGAEATDELLLLEDGDVLVTQTAQERSAADGSGTTAHERDLCVVALRELVDRGKRRVANLLHVHLLELLHCELLKTADVDRALLSVVEVAATNAELAGGAHHATRETHRVIRKDHLGSPVVVLVRDRADERLDVDRSWAALLAGRVGALQAPL